MIGMIEIWDVTTHPLAPDAEAAWRDQVARLQAICELGSMPVVAYVRAEMAEHLPAVVAQRAGLLSTAARARAEWHLDTDMRLSIVLRTPRLVPLESTTINQWERRQKS